MCCPAAYTQNRSSKRRRRSTVCESEDWRKQSLKTVREIPVAGILGDLKGETKFEASGIAQRGSDTGQYFVVFDKCAGIPGM